MFQVLRLLFQATVISSGVKRSPAIKRLGTIAIENSAHCIPMPKQENQLLFVYKLLINYKALLVCFEKDRLLVQFVTLAV